MRPYINIKKRKKNKKIEEIINILCSPSRVYVLRGQTNAERDEWMRAFIAHGAIIQNEHVCSYFIIILLFLNIFYVD